MVTLVVWLGYWMEMLSCDFLWTLPMMVTFGQRMGNWPRSWLDSTIQLGMHGLIQWTCSMVDLMAMDGEDCCFVEQQRQLRPIVWVWNYLAVGWNEIVVVVAVVETVVVELWFVELLHRRYVQNGNVVRMGKNQHCGRFYSILSCILDVFEGFSIRGIHEQIDTFHHIYILQLLQMGGTTRSCICLRGKEKYKLIFFVVFNQNLLGSTTYSSINKSVWIRFDWSVRWKRVMITI